MQSELVKQREDFLENDAQSLLLLRSYFKGTLMTNADLKIYKYLCLHIKIICRKFRIITAFTF